MRKMALVIALLLGGCMNDTTTPYGNFIEEGGNLDQEKIAGDTVRHLVTLYPPAKSRFALQQATSDRFGQALLSKLRERGYALLEFTDKAEVKQSPDSSLPLRYVLDRVDGMNLYRLTLMVGNRALTRPYLRQNGATVAAGYWSQKE